MVVINHCPVCGRLMPSADPGCNETKWRQWQALHGAPDPGDDPTSFFI